MKVDIIQLASCWESGTHQDKLFTEVENAPFLSNTGPKEDWVRNISYHSSGEKEQPNSIITKGKMILPPFPKLQKVSVKKILSSFFLLPLNPIVVCVVP